MPEPSRTSTHFLNRLDRVARYVLLRKSQGTAAHLPSRSGHGLSLPLPPTLCPGAPPETSFVSTYGVRLERLAQSSQRGGTAAHCRQYGWPARSSELPIQNLD